MNPAASIQAFASIFPAELPDKTMVACLVLVSRHQRRSAVFAGVAAAFALHVTVAVLAGGLLAELPAGPVAVVTALVFAFGAVTLWRSTRKTRVDVSVPAAPAAAESSFPAPACAESSPAGRTPVGAPGLWTAASASFGVIALAEFGDLTQLATAGLAARTGAPFEVAVGSLAALCAVAGLAILFGRTLLRWFPAEMLQRVAAVLFGILAVVTLVDVF